MAEKFQIIYHLLSLESVKSYLPEVQTTSSTAKWLHCSLYFLIASGIIFLIEIERKISFVGGH